MKFFTTIRGKIGTLLGAFFLLVIVSVGVTFLSLRAQADDAAIINMAGRQRMLTQRMTWLALARPNDPELIASIVAFEQTLSALMEGGHTLDASGNPVQLPPPPDDELFAQLEEVAQTWGKFKAHLQPPDSEQLPFLASAILAQLDGIVSAFETRAEIKQQRLVLIQISFLLAALLLLAWGFVTTRRRIINPLAELGGVVRKMGTGNLQAEMPALADDELGELGGAFESMRTELAASRRMLEEQVDLRTRELIAAFEFSQEIVTQRDLETLMISAIERARSLMDAQSAALCVLTPDGDELVLMASSGENTTLPGLRQSVQRGIALPVIVEGQTVIENTVCSDCGFLAAQKPGGCAATPLQADGQTIGALCVARSKNGNGTAHPRFDVNGQRALSLLANSAAIAITNARLAEAERQKAEEAASLTEREQLAADLHDNLAQTLSFTRFQLEQLEENIAHGQSNDAHATLKQIETANETAYQQVRDSLVGLLKPPPSNDDFLQKLSSVVDDFRSSHNLPVELKISDPSALALPPVTQIQIIHIVGEALSNIHQHAQAEQAWVSVDRLNRCASFTIKDDGCGFDLDQPPKDGHFGLQIMHTRARRSGGQLKVNSAPGEGTCITISFPLAGHSIGEHL